MNVAGTAFLGEALRQLGFTELTTKISGAADTVQLFFACLICLSNRILDSRDDSNLHLGHVLVP